MLQTLVQGVAVRLHSNPFTRVAPSSRRRAARAAGGVSFISSERNKEEKMEKEEEEEQQQQKDPAKDLDHGDTMAHSFGEGYSTRSDDEGFGGIYGGNQVFGNRSLDAHPDFDKSQGSEVKEKEKARNQPH